MNFKKRDEAIFTSEVYYDLFEGGYIKPEELLVSETEANIVNTAIGIVRDFLDEAEEAGVLEMD